ncbi:hypothetical protein AOA59_29595 [Pseudomonas sp. 2822-15]|uniref:hypothetical protein n=1 Tax=Pseudomonas sp. 2822-15 TaxID=1712677 RepID=UPI000C14ABBE|nr:hypothetical protein [Pseudomonas sp. 2822-15]PIB39825.1 hypothetical protein AOA59_29595 [Pseudomonas sp. 2822-15]
MPKILDVIKTKQGQMFLLLDEMPRRVYERTGNLLVSSHGGFFDFMKIVPGTRDAFAGRSFSINLSDGSTLECKGQVWDSGGDPGVPTVHVGIGTRESLESCYVFSAATVARSLVEAWLSENKPSSRYYKYDKRETVEYWEDIYRTEGWGNRISSARARKLRKRGATIWRVDGRPTWSARFEKRKAQILADIAADA